MAQKRRWTTHPGNGMLKAQKVSRIFMKKTASTNDPSKFFLNGPPHHSTGRRNLIIVIVLVTLLLGGGVFALVTYINATSQKYDNVTRTPTPTQPTTAVTAITKNAQKIAQEKSTVDAVIYLKDEANKTTNSTEKARILGTIVTYVSADQSPAAQKTALDYQLESYQLEKTEASAAIIGGMYGRQGDTANAIVYYKLAIEHAKKSSTQGDGEEGVSSYKFYENEITYLESQR